MDVVMIRYISIVSCLCIALGCSENSSGQTEAENPVDAGVNQVPFDGEIAPPPPADVVDDRSFFPLYDGAEWRYRKKTNQWNMPPAVTEGARSVVELGEEDNEFRRKTVAFLTLTEGETTRSIAQTLTETFVVQPSDRRVGPIVQVKGITIEERSTDDDSLIRRTVREYLPPYGLFTDAWRTGEFDTRINQQVNLTETITSPEMDEPRVVRGLVDVEVVTDINSQILPMEGQYRENVFQVDVSDHFGSTKTRTYWVQQGVGPVQWQFQATNNQIFTLIRASIEAAPSE
jgi:hypothetical protein